ncbi:MAG: aldehyde dehydrogenase family protein [Gammaproteobacteria bacterium]|nr:aldehyde dehydrogenase family protein [Gammaproteobacteria bacterium]
MTFLKESDFENQDLPIYINGECVKARSDGYIESIDPATGKYWYRLANCGELDVDEAVKSASDAFKGQAWSKLTPTDRGELLHELARLIGLHASEFAEIETRDNGKLLKETQAQIRYLTRYYRYFAGMADKIQGDVIPINRTDMLNYTTREPIGVVGLIVPWNSPLNTMSVTAAACLAAGNTLVVKPSEHTSASTIAFAQLVGQAGFPEGVFNVITGEGRIAGDLLTRHEGVSKIAFTGGSDTGRKIAANAAEHLAPCVLELGGKSPQVIYQDADIERAVNGVIAGVFAASGQTCVAGSRCLVEHKIYDEVVDRLAERAKTIRVGHPKDPDTHIGPLATLAQYHKVSNYVQYGLEDGAKLVFGGSKVRPKSYEEGYFYLPTIFSGVDNEMRISQDEIFGPIVGIQPFNDEADLMQKANDTRYGLASGIWTRDIDKAMRFAKEVQAGTVWVNTYRTAGFTTPMGGFKDSGYGKHNGLESMMEWTRSKNVMIDYSGSTQDAFVIRVK